MDEGGLLRVGGRVPYWHWEKEENRLQFLEYVGRVLDVQCVRDWHSVKRSDVERLGGRGLLMRYSSLLSCLSDAYPELVEKDNRADVRAKKGRGFWNLRQNRKRFLEDAAPLLGIKSVEDWASVSRNALIRVGGRGAFQHFSTVKDLVIDAYPEEEATLRAAVSVMKEGKSDWTSREKRHAFLESMGTKLGVSLPSEWFLLQRKHFDEAGGAGLLQKYGNSRRALFLSVYKESDIQESVGGKGRVSRGYWSAMENRRRFLDDVKAAHAVKELSDWARVSSRTVQNMGGMGLLAHYNGSLFEALQDVYREEGQWDMLLCRRSSPQGYWDSKEHVEDFIRCAEKEIGVLSTDDWYRVSFQQVRELPRGASLLQRYTLLDALSIAYPSVQWDRKALLSVGKKAAQRHMLQSLAAIFSSRAAPSEVTLCYRVNV